MKILKIYPTNINEKYIDQVVEELKNGHIIIYPTDSLYAIGCDALNNNAIQKICRIKNINPDKTNLSIICNDLSQASEYAKIDNRAFRYLKEFLPGSFTFILPAATTLPKIFKGRKTVGLRIPDNIIPRCIAEKLGNPIITTSIEITEENIYEGCDPEEIATRYDNIASVIIDGGIGGTEASTIVDLTDSSEPRIIRQGSAKFQP